MKKTLLLLMLLVLTLSCSNDDSENTAPVTDIYMKVLSLGAAYPDNVTTYYINYGTSETDQVMLEVSEKVFRFYSDRVNNNNLRWIGEVDHE